MIKLDGPHMGLNDPRTTNRVQMWNTWDVAEDETVDHMVEQIAAVARATPGRKLRNLVFRCHGNPGSLQVGEGIDAAALPRLAPLNGLVDQIWCSACLVARIATGSSFAGGDGNRFCADLARTVGAFVVAATELQVIGTNRVLPYGCLDTFEGLVLTWNPEGRIVGGARFHSTWDRGRGRGGMASNPD